MKKIFITLLTVALIISAFALAAFAADEPKVTCDAIGYVDFTNGNNNNDGLSAATAKKQLMSIDANGIISLMKDGGTMVVSGKLFIAGEYQMPKLGSTLFITSNDGTTDYKKLEPANNPACALKMSQGSSMKLYQDTIIDDIILFQETKESNTISITAGCTLVIGEKVITVGSPYSSEPCYMSLYAEKGATLIVKSGTYQKITGDGEIIISEDVEIIEKNAIAEDKKDMVANALYSLGLVKGYDDSGSDFRLNNKLTRAESIVQIVRFLGAEQAALNGNYTVSFEDVPAWAVPYIGYAYANGITSGRSEKVFDPDGIVDEAQFLTLLLRAMDYSDKDGDFTWNNPYELANKVGLIDHTEASAVFSRGDAFVACYNSLASKCKGGETVAEKLINNDVIAEKAYGYAKRIANGETIIVACVGDSVTQGTGSSPASIYSYPAQLQKLLGKGFKVVNCGKAASYVMNLDSPYNVKKKSPNLWYPNTAEYTKYMSSSAEIVIVMLGTNDARSMTDVAAEADFVASYKALIADLRTLDTVKEMYLSSMIPAPNGDITYQGTVYTLPRLIKSIADELGLPFIPTHENVHDYYNVMLNYNDSVHPTNTTYPRLAYNFYNEVFAHKADVPMLPVVDSKVVYVSNFGKVDNDGKTADTAVNTLGLAVSMLRESGGTVVVCGPLTTKITYLVECADNVTVTSVYGGVDYRETNSASIILEGNITLASELTLENVTINTSSAGKSINCNYNNFTVGEGVVCIGTKDIAVNVGYRIGSGAITAYDVSCHEDCKISITSGTWSILRGGNMRTASATPIGTVDKGVTLNISISGGEFTYDGVNATSAVGMNGCDGNVVFNISGGSFTGGVYGIHRTGSNVTGTVAQFNGNIAMNITGGTFAKEIGLYHTADTPKVNGDAVITISNSLKSVAKLDGFDKTNFVD
ncbi:MAG: S-layer homology domain-containing protein [Clostridia bacterium]|nr:S-layer homology domain-containing protein [Clostridia bacterium]